MGSASGGNQHVVFLSFRDFSRRGLYGLQYALPYGILAMDTPHTLGHHASVFTNRVLILGRLVPQSLSMPSPPYFLRAKVHDCSIPTETVIVGLEQSAQRCPVSRPLLEELGHELPFPRWVLTGNVRWRAIRFELGRGGEKLEIVGAQKL